MKNSIKKNFFYNSLMLFFNIGFPLITAPYVSRILGVVKIGELNFGISFVNWFILISSLGLPVYATREIARVRENKEKLNEVFNEILKLLILSTGFTLFLYFVLIFLIPSLQIYNKVLFIYSLNLILSIFSLDWFYYGMEEYEYISKRSILFKFISLFLIFIFVREGKDFYRYILILIFGMGASNILNILKAKKYIKINFKFEKKIFKHINFAKIFYLQAILGSVYSSLNQIILGITSSPEQLGYYSRGYQLTMLAITVILSFVRTITPRLARDYMNNRKEYESLVDLSFKITSFLVFPCLVGIFSLAESLMYFFGGEQFLQGAIPLKVLSVLIVFTVYSTFLDTNISLPSGNEKNTLYGNIGVSIVTLIATLLLAKKWGALGVAMAIVLGESIGMMIQLIKIKSQNLYLGFFNKNIFKYILSAIAMGIVLNLLVYNLKVGYIMKLIISIPMGAATYFTGIFLLSELMKTDNEIYFFYEKIKFKR